MPAAPPLPSRIGKYEIERRLGGGGMAEIFLARLVGAEGFTRRVAIKRVLPGHAKSPAFAKMFVTEARLLATLSHPNIVSVVDFDQDPQQGLFLAMELIEGSDLDQLIATGLLPIPVVIYLCVEILRGLGYAHNVSTGGGRRGIVHRDVSPHNVLVSWQGAVKVSDFGLAKARASSNETAGDLLKGKPAYMSPEQANGQPLDGRSDLFSVGVMLWEMLIGQPLFSGPTAQETLARVIISQIPTPAQIRKDVPADLSAVSMRLLERELGQRYPTAAHAVQALMACGAAPHDGRAELIKVMSDRFSSAAPTLPVAASDAEAAPSIVNPPKANLAELRRRMRQDRAHAVELAGRPGNRWRWVTVFGVGVATLVLALVVLAASDRRKGASVRAASDAADQAAIGRDAGAPTDAAQPAAPLSASSRDSALARDAAAVDVDDRSTPVPAPSTAKRPRSPRNQPSPTDAAPDEVPPAPAPKPTLDLDGDGIPDVR